MKFSLKNELPIILIIIAPFVYLSIVWSSLPDMIPVHWSAKGEINRMGSKLELILTCFMLPVLTYLIFLIIPIVDRKRNLQNMGNKLTKLKFALTFIMSVLAIYFIYVTQQQQINSVFVTMLVGTVFVVLGNFFPTIKPNYFIGIRIPWTMNDENNWKKTHQFSGKIWILGGIAIIINSLISDKEKTTLYFLIITFSIIIIPIFYSYKLHLKNKKA